MEPFQQLIRRIDAQRAEMVAFQQEITSIPALSPDSGGQGEYRKSAWIRKYLEQLPGVDIRQIDAPDKRAERGIRPNLIARLSGRSSARTTWLMAHMDVVPEGDLSKWQTNPWEAVERDGRLYGRGTEDNQQGLTSSVFTLKAFVDEGIQPEYDLCVLLAADEETGSEFGLQYVLKHHQELFSKEDLIIVPDAGERDSIMIEIAEKSSIWLEFHVEGKQCHASLPQQGINAFTAASNLVVRLSSLYSTFDVRDEVFAPPISTFEPTKKLANVPNINTIPGEDRFFMDCRLLPAYSVVNLLGEIGRICATVEADFAVRVNVSPVQVSEAAPPTSADAPVVQALKQAIRSVYKVEARPMGIGGGTVAAFFRRAGLPAAVWSTLDDVCHQPNEYCVIDYMVNDAKVFAHVCLQP